MSTLLPPDFSSRKRRPSEDVLPPSLSCGSVVGGVLTGLLLVAKTFLPPLLSLQLLLLTLLVTESLTIVAPASLARVGSVVSAGPRTVLTSSAGEALRDTERLKSNTGILLRFASLIANADEEGGVEGVDGVVVSV